MDAPSKLLYTIDEAAALLAIGRTHCYDYVLTGTLPSVKLGKSRRIPAAGLEDFVQRLQADGVELR